MHSTVARMHSMHSMRIMRPHELSKDDSYFSHYLNTLTICVTVSIAPHSYTVTVTVNASTRLLVPSHRRPDVKLWQCLTLMREVQQISTSRDLAVIVCGDFNR